MRGVSTAWRSRLESTATRLSINFGRSGSAIPKDLAARWPLLVTLNLQGGPKVTPWGLRCLQSLGKLANLALEIRTKDLTEGLVEAMHALSLSKLDLTVDTRDFGSSDYYNSLTDAHLKLLRGLPLEALSTGPGFDQYHKISDAGMESLRGLPLTRLRLFREERGPCDPEITDAGLKMLRGMPLTDLDLAYCGGFSGIGFKELAVPLTTLNLSSTEVTDTGLAGLQGLPLKVLALEMTNITDVGLEWLRGMQLERLNIADTSITGSGLSALVGMPLTDLGEICFKTNEPDFSELVEFHVLKFWKAQFLDCKEKLDAALGSNKHI